MERGLLNCSSLRGNQFHFYLSLIPNPALDSRCLPLRKGFSQLVRVDAALFISLSHVSRSTPTLTLTPILTLRCALGVYSLERGFPNWSTFRGAPHCSTHGHTSRFYYYLSHISRSILARTLTLRCTLGVYPLERGFPNWSGLTPPYLYLYLMSLGQP